LPPFSPKRSDFNPFGEKHPRKLFSPNSPIHTLGLGDLKFPRGPKRNPPIESRYNPGGLKPGTPPLFMRRIWKEPTFLEKRIFALKNRI